MTIHPDGRALLARDHVAASRALALFCAAGGAWLIGVGASVPGFGGHGLLLAASIALGVLLLGIGAGAWFRPERVPRWALASVAPVSVALIGGLNLITSDATTGSQLFLLWPVLYAASFLSRRHTAEVLAAVLVVEAVVMGSLETPSRAVVDTLGLVLAYTMAAVAVLTFRARVESLLDALGAQAREDALTGLPNRRAFDEALAGMCAMAHRTGEPLSLVSVDVDLFKGVNDTRGHAAGDQVLCAVAEALRGSGRDVDVVARVGGDEFAMLLASCPHDDALAVARGLQGLVTAHTTRIGAPVGVSVGVATIPQMADTPEELMVAADAALYAAKLAGREGAEVPAARI